MYLHLGEKTSVPADEIVGIFDIDNTTVMKNTRNYLAKAQDSGKVINVSYDLPKSFIVTVRGGKYSVYISPVAPSTLLKRVNEGKIYKF